MILVQHHSRCLTFLLRFKFHPSLCIECIIFLTDSEIGTMIAVRYFSFLHRAAASPDGDSANSFLHRFLLHLPAVCPVFLPETDMIGSTAYFLWKRYSFVGSSNVSSRCPTPSAITGHPFSHVTFARKVSLPMLLCPSQGLDASITTYQFPLPSSTRSPCPA